MVLTVNEYCNEIPQVLTDEEAKVISLFKKNAGSTANKIAA